MSVEIREVKTKRDFVKFVKFPLRMYRHHPQYVPDLYIDSIANLDADKNPMGKYSKFTKFLAFKDGKVVGRVAAIIVSDGLTSSMTRKYQGRLSKPS